GGGGQSGGHFGSCGLTGVIGLGIGACAYSKMLRPDPLYSWLSTAFKVEVRSVGSRLSGGWLARGRPVEAGVLFCAVNVGLETEAAETVELLPELKIRKKRSAATTNKPITTYTFFRSSKPAFISSLLSSFAGRFQTSDSGALRLPFDLRMRRCR